MKAFTSGKRKISQTLTDPFNSKYDLIGAVGITGNEFMTDLKKSISLEMDSNDEGKESLDI